MQVSQSFFTFLASQEGEKLCPYLDVAGIPTIGIGSTYYEDGTKVKMTDSCITHSRAVQICMNVLKDFEATISALAPDVSQNQFDALVSFSYNIGTGAFRSSTLLKRIKAGANEKDIREAFNMWTKVRNPKTGKLDVNDWQVKRRKAEANLYFKA